MKLKFISVTEIVFLAVFLLTGVAYANSSWVWISETRPYDILPYVIIVTLIIEIGAILLIPKLRNFIRVAGIVILGNALSFGMPFLLASDQIYTFNQILEKRPFYISILSFLIFTIIIELPVVYIYLERFTDNKKKLLWTIICSNVVTTGLTAIVEGIFCKGMYV